MPKRLDPDKGLPGLFSKGSGEGRDMAFLVRSSPKRDLEKKQPGGVEARKPRAPRKPRASKPASEVAPALAPAITTTTSSLASDAPIAVTVEAPIDLAALERAALLRDCAPPVLVPDLVEPRARLTLREASSLVGCVGAWALSALTQVWRRGNS